MSRSCGLKDLHCLVFVLFGTMDLSRLLFPLVVQETVVDACTTYEEISLQCQQRFMNISMNT